MNLFAGLLTLLAIAGVNSACNVVFGQPEEPKTLSRYKKIKE
ncbi:cyclic lactone autoinducer peptide [Allocoprobacillus halotolerans]